MIALVILITLMCSVVYADTTSPLPFVPPPAQHVINAVDPSPENNPGGVGFPGYRGSNQMLIYDSGYGQPTTGTNEFGFEVTVTRGRVTAQEGANSTIPTGIANDPANSYVLSGHGQSRQWLLQNAPLGSLIQRQGNSITSILDKETYLFQLDQMVQDINKLNPKAIPSNLQAELLELKDNPKQLSDDEIIRQMMALKAKLTPALWAAYPPLPVTETKAIWHRPQEKTLAQIRQSLDLMQQAGINTIFLETYLHGDPIFPSKTFEKYHIAQTLPFTLKDRPNANLLTTWLDEAHRRKMTVHVWFQTFYAGNRQTDHGMGSILTAYPTWANIQKSGLNQPALPPSTLEPGSYFLDPANEAATNFLLDLINEIVSNYPIDGFQLDYIRYPGSFPPDHFSYVATTWGYTQAARNIFKTRFLLDPADLTPDANPTEWAEWNAFKMHQIDRFVDKAHSLIKLSHPQLSISVAIFPKLNEAITRKEQNWAAWAQAGDVDFIAPMTLTSAIDTIAGDTKTVHDLTHLPVVTGIFGPFNGNTPTQVVEQCWSAVQAEAAGLVLFDTAHFTQSMAEALHAGLFKTPAKK